MESILTKLYLDNHSTTVSAELQCLLDLADPYYQRISETFSDTYTSELWDALTALGIQESKECFIEGLRLGLNLLLELFPGAFVTPPKTPSP